MSNPLVIEKRRLRQQVRESRAQRSAAQIAELEPLVADQLDALVRRFDARRVACFLSFPGEPPTREFLRRARDRGLEVILPVSEPEGQLGWLLDTGREQPGRYAGVPEPIGDRIPGDGLATADLILIPAALVDRAGYRLGWGGGYYDRALVGRTAPVYALIHDEEFVAQVPREPHDQPVHGVVTPNERYSFRR